MNKLTALAAWVETDLMKQWQKLM